MASDVCFWPFSDLARCPHFSRYRVKSGHHKLEPLSLPLTHSLKALDPNRPIREADMEAARWGVTNGTVLDPKMLYSF